MRESIGKYRGKSLLDDRWVYGSLVIQKDVCLMFPWKSSYGGIFAVDPDTVGEFTTLKELSTSKEVYEGDSIDCGCGEFPIEWDDVSTGWVVNVGNDIFGLHQYLYEFKGKICGTIHDKEKT